MKLSMKPESDSDELEETISGFGPGEDGLIVGDDGLGRVGFKTCREYEELGIGSSEMIEDSVGAKVRVDDVRLEMGGTKVSGVARDSEMYGDVLEGFRDIFAKSEGESVVNVSDAAPDIDKFAMGVSKGAAESEEIEMGVSMGIYDEVDVEEGGN